MDVLGHYYVSGNEEVIPGAGSLESFEEAVARLGSAEEWVTVLTAEGDEVETAGFLETSKTPGHESRVVVDRISRCDLLKRIQSRISEWEM
jgi:hypothetical protein